MTRFGAVLGAAIIAACTPIEPVPLSNAPVNRCSCEAFGSGVRCSTLANRCESGPSGSRPSFPFFIVVHVPESSSYGSGQTFVLYSGTGGAPAFTRVHSASAPTGCQGPRCVALSGMTLVTSQYRVSARQSERAGFPLKERQLIPVRVEYEPVAASQSQPDFPAGLPLLPRFLSARAGVEGAETSVALPSGVYRRILYPEPPFDALFPPRATFQDLRVAPEEPLALDRLELQGPDPLSARDPQRADYRSVLDSFLLDDSRLDPVDTRGVTVQRAEGLDGWQVWVADRRTKRRISVLKTLSGTDATLTMDTSGEKRSEANNGLGDDVEVVVAPPASYFAVPRFINPVNGGDLGTIRYPSLPPPVRVRGGVVQPDRADLGFAAQLHFESTTLDAPRDPNPLLHYATSVSTDDSGRFQTVLPPGNYTVTIEPLVGTGFALDRQPVIVAATENDDLFLPLRPPRRTVVQGRVLIADGRPLAEAEIVAVPRTPTTAIPKPRPNHTRAGLDGRFSFDLDQGPYVITAIPKAATGFPRVAVPTIIIPQEQDLPDITIPAPIGLSFQLRGADFSEGNVENATVRIFAAPTQTSDEAIEMGVGATGPDGQVEILLAPTPP